MARSGHCLLIGQTESGKTICAQRIAQAYKAGGIKVCVLDPMKDPKWNADFITDNPDEYFSLVMDPDRSLQCALFIDEAGQSLDRYVGKQQWLTCQARHHGHVTHIISQRAQQVDTTIRSQCSTVYAFNVAVDDAKLYAKSFNAPVLLKCPTLPQGHCIRVQRFQPTQYLRMW